MSALKYTETQRFTRLLKQLTKRFRSLPSDLETVKKAAIELRHVQGIDNQSCFELQGHENGFCEFYKVKKFACRALKGKGSKSGIRLIYAFHPNQSKVVFIEIYFKADQTRESRTLIVDYLRSLSDEG